MAGKLASLLIKISADGASAEKELRSLEKKMANTAKEFEKVGKAMSKYVTLPLTALAGVSVAAANTQLQAEAKLLNALQGREDVQQRLIDQAGELQSRSTLGDEAIIEQQAFLAALGLSEKQIGDTIEAAAQLSVALDMDLGSAVKNLAKTYGGMTGELGESVPALKELTEEQLKAGEAVKYVNENYKGFAETAANTGAGPLVQLKNTLGDVAEQFGVLLLPALQKLAGWLKNVAKWLQNLSPEWKKTIVTVGAVVVAIGPLAVGFSKVLNAVKLFKLAIPGLKIAMSGMLGPIGLLVTAVATLAGAWMSAQSAQERYNEEQKEVVSQIKQQRRDYLQSATDKWINEYSRPIYSDEELRKISDRYREYYNSAKDIYDFRKLEQERNGYTDEEYYDLASYAAKVNAIVAVLEQRKKLAEDSAAIQAQLAEDISQTTEGLLGETNAFEEQSGIIANLKTKIEELNKAKETATTEAEIKRINGLLEETTAELQRVSNLKNVEVKIAVKVETPSSVNTTSLTGVSINTDQVAQHLSDRLGNAKALSDFRKFWDNLSAEAERGAETVAQIGSTLKSSLSSLATTLGEGLGNLISGLDVDPGKALLELLGNSLKSLGAALVTYATTMQAFKDALKRIFLDPISAILLGTGAIALGQMFVNMAKEPIKLANGGLAYGPTLAVVGDNRGAASDPEVIAPLSKLRNYMGGQQLELVGGVSFELRGDVARAIINRENVRLNRKG